MGPAETRDAPTGSVAQAIEHAARLLGAAPHLAEQQAREILAVVPNEPRAAYLIGAAKRRLGDPAGASAVLEPLASSQPNAAAVHYELGQTRAALSDGEGAIAALRRAVTLKPDMPEGWRALADQLFLKGELEAADAAYARNIQASIQDPALMEAAQALADDRIAVAERLLRAHLQRFPTDVAALRMLAEAGTRLGQYRDAERLLAHCLELAPSFLGARHGYAIVLYRQQKAAEAIPQIERLLADDPRDPGYRSLLAAALGLVGDYARASAIYEQVLAEQPRQPKIWLSYGHSLRTAGRKAEAIAAYQRAISMSPSLGEAYWSLANLKTERFSASEEAAMRSQLAEAEVSDEDRLHLHFALAKALEDREAYPGSFEHYSAGAALRRAQIPYDAAARSEEACRSHALFTHDFFAERAGWGSTSPAPIFIVGLPRSGSTLIEQILASHSQIEGTMELPYIVAAAMELGAGASKDPPYPNQIATLSREDCARLGEEFLASAAIHRKQGRPFFIDKMPNNFRHIGLIQLVLPNARIVDARRHPMAACFSAFKQHFARGQGFSYDLTDLGRYYRDYVELMAHFDQALPGRIHRVIYEDLVEDIDGEVRRLLDYCGLTFEAACLRFHENDRAVRTASSEQVRRPIFREGLDQWKNYAAWLEPLRDALGPTLETWRA
jgi:cytochrome c-type biogenesis protein CcmH/NrfG